MATSATKPREFNYVRDSYTVKRGKPKMLEVTCAKCNAWVLDYQKDGPGRLLRLYVDRIYHPSALRERHFTRDDMHTVPALKCQRCFYNVAVPMIYQAENRPAYRILRFNGGPALNHNERHR